MLTSLLMTLLLWGSAWFAVSLAAGLVYCLLCRHRPSRYQPRHVPAGPSTA